MKHPTSVPDYRKLACAKLPRVLFDYLDGGALNEITINENYHAYQRIQLHKRILQDVPHTDTTTEILGQKIAQPLILAPVGFAGLYARRGEEQAARAAEKAGVPFCLSTLSICSIEEVRRATQSFWFQYYMLDDKNYGLELLKRAHSAGCPVLVFTVDVPIFGVRYRDMRHGIFSSKNVQPSLSMKLNMLWQYLSHPHWFWNVFLRGQPLIFGNFEKTRANFRRITNYRISLTWKDLEWVRKNWPGKLVLKGVLDPEDAHKAADMGVDGIVVSNHAGRHLDSTPPTISVLPEIAEAVADRMTIIIDGGIFSGHDVLKALSLGAHACMIGRAWVYAMAARGEQGVSDILKMLQMELEITMIHLGIANIRQIDRSYCLASNLQQSGRFS